MIACCVEDIVRWHVAKLGGRWAGLEPIRQGVRATQGAYTPKVALALTLRYNRGWLLERHGYWTPAAARASFTWIAW